MLASNEHIENTKGKNYIFAIGVDKYLNFRNLCNPVKDISDVINELVTRYEFEIENVISLENEKATKDKITNELGRIVKELNESDNLIFYFAGHAETDFDAGYLIPHDARAGMYTKVNIGDCITYNDLIATYFDFIKVQHLFVIIDACFPSCIFEARGGRKGRESTNYKSRYAIASGRKHPVSDGREGQNSPFAKVLLQVLCSNISDISVEKLSDGIIEKLGKKTTVNYGPLNVDNHFNGRFVLKRKISESTLRDWEQAKKIMTKESFSSFLKKNPKSIFEERAKELKTLSRHWENGLDELNEFYNKYIECLDKPEVFFLHKIEQLRQIERLENYTTYSNELLKCIIELKKIVDRTFGLEHAETNFINEKRKAEFEKEYTTECRYKNSQKTFLILKRPVTISNYKEYTDKTGEEFPYALEKMSIEDREKYSLKDSDPVRNISWYEAVDYTEWVNKELNASFRLPTLEEWKEASNSINIEGGYQEWCFNEIDLSTQDDKDNYSEEELGYPVKAIISKNGESIMKPELSHIEVGFRLVHPIKPNSTTTS